MKRLFLLYLVALIGVTACGRRDVSVPMLDWTDEGVYVPRSSGEGLVVAPDSPIPDVPVPVGYVPLVNQSESGTAAGGGRLVNHLYQGRGDLDEILQFYRQNLPRFGWRAAGRETEPAPNRRLTRTEEITFVKGSEEIRVRAWKRERLMTMQVAMGPRGQLPPPAGPAAQP